MSGLKSPDGLTRDDVCKLFNKAVQQLAKKLFILSKKSIKVESLMNQLSMAIQEDREIVIKEAGPKIYEHRKIIEEKDEDFFAKIDFQSQYGQIKEFKSNMDLFLLVKEQWPKMKGPERVAIGDIVQSLLDNYMIYLVFQKIESGKIKADAVGFTTE
jgi:hypothetical protein